MQHDISSFSRFFRSFACIFCASFVLVGCSYFDTGESAGLETQKSTMDMADYDAQPVDLSKVIAANTGGSVQIFSFDEPAPAVDYEPVTVETQTSGAVEVSAVPSVPVMREPISSVQVFSADPSVQIFPFDDMPMAPADLAPIAAPAQAMRKEEFVAVNDANGQKVIVYFNHDSATLGQNALKKLDALAGSFNAASRALTVEGHASIRANYNNEAQRRVVNLKISMDRAFAVASALLQRGVPAEAIRVMAWGDAQPSRELNGKSAEEAARRVEISG